MEEGPTQTVPLPSRWRVIGRAEQTAVGMRLIDALEAGNQRAVTVFKDNRQTFSALIELDGNAYVLKIPRDRNNRPWQRLLSALRPSEAVRHYHSMRQLEELSLSGPEPIVAVEKRHRGLVVDSALLYRFREGRSATERDAALILPQLLALHDAGYLRNDPHAKNYLIDNGAVVFIDFRLTRPRLLRRLRLRRELALFLKTSPEAWNHLPEHLARCWWLQLAVVLDEAARFVRHSRRRLRRLPRHHH